MRLRLLTLTFAATLAANADLLQLANGEQQYWQNSVIEWRNEPMAVYVNPINGLQFTSQVQVSDYVHREPDDKCYCPWKAWVPPGPPPVTPPPVLPPPKGNPNPQPTPIPEPSTYLYVAWGFVVVRSIQWMRWR